MLVLILTFAGNIQAKTKASKYVVSYSDHKSIIKRYVPALEQAYKDIGINAEFVLVNDRRSLRLLQKGRIDADAVKTLEILNKKSNFIPLPTPISKIEVMLLCRPEIECHLGLLQNHKKTLGVVAAKEFYQELLAEAKINIRELSSFHAMRQMFRQNRLDAMISVFDPAVEDPRLTYANYVKIKEKLGHHLVHKKHKKLVLKLDSAVQKRLYEQVSEG